MQRKRCLQKYFACRNKKIAIFKKFPIFLLTFLLLFLHLSEQKRPILITERDFPTRLTSKDMIFKATVKNYTGNFLKILKIIYTF